MKSGEKWIKVGKSWEKWLTGQKVGISGKKWGKVVKSMEKYGKVEKVGKSWKKLESGEKW